jgi:hypothetical protein
MNFWYGRCDSTLVGRFEAFSGTLDESDIWVYPSGRGWPSWGGPAGSSVYRAGRLAR